MKVIIRDLCLATVLASGIGLAGWPAECAAQTGSQQQGMSLRAAIEEARGSPFHAAATVAGPGEARLSQAGIDAEPASNRFQPEPRTESAGASTVALTYVAAGLSHMAATYLFWRCANDEGYDSSAAGCAAASIVPLVVVPAPAALAGAGLGRSLGASAVGLGAGAAAYLAAMLTTEGISNANPVVAGFVSGAVHAGVVNALVR